MSMFPKKPVMEELTTAEMCADLNAAFTRVTAEHRRRMRIYNIQTFLTGCLILGAMGVFLIGLTTVLGWFG